MATKSQKPDAQGTKPAPQTQSGSAADKAADVASLQTTTAQAADAMLKADHRKVEGLFEKFESASSASEKAGIVRQICNELIMHTMLEEEIFYPACREKQVESDILDEAQVEHDGAKMLICELQGGSPEDAFYDAKVSVLSEYIKHHVGEEEKRSDGIFAKARSAGLDMNALGQRLRDRKQELLAKAERGGLGAPQPRSLTPSKSSMDTTKEYEDMPRQQHDYRERDDRGRFMSDDDDRNEGRYPGRSQRDERGRFMGDDDRNEGRYSGRSQRDERGRFMSDDDRNDGRYSSRMQRDDDDRRGGGSSGNRGWSGDPEGHSQAARRGWDERSGYGGYGSYGGRGGSRYDEDDRGGRSGWYGDTEGHSEASRRGWDERHEGGSRSSGRYENDERDRYARGSASERGGYGGASRSRSDDDDDRGSSSRMSRGGRSSDDDNGRHGGWFGDSRGHAAAARKGWRNRD